MKRIESIMSLTDTSKNTLLENSDFMSAIEKTIYKSQLMMISNQKTFIRGIFLNLFKPKLSSGLEELKQIQQVNIILIRILNMKKIILTNFMRTLVLFIFLRWKLT